MPMVGHAHRWYYPMRFFLRDSCQKKCSSQMTQCQKNFITKEFVLHYMLENLAVSAIESTINNY
jgi:hypothetical protein